MGLPNVCPMCKSKKILEHAVGHKTFVAIRTYKIPGMVDEVREVMCADCGNVYAVDCDPAKLEVVELAHHLHPLHKAVKERAEILSRKEG